MSEQNKRVTKIKTPLFKKSRHLDDNSENNKFKRLIVSAVFIGLILSVLIVILILHITMSKENQQWKEMTTNLTEEEANSCDILKVVDYTKTFNPRGIHMTVEYYKTDNIYSLDNLMNYTTIMVTERTADIPQIKNDDFIKACSDDEGYITGIEVVGVNK